MAADCELLHGLSFSVFLVPGVTLARNLAPKGLEATSQGIFTGVHFGAAGMVGAYMGGELLDAVGIYKMHLIASIVSSAGLLVFMAYRRRHRAPKGHVRQ